MHDVSRSLTDTENRRMEFSARLASIEALGFATSAALCAMLLFTHWELRASDDRTPAYTWLWISGLVYSVSAFAATLLELATPTVGPRAVQSVESIVWSATCIGPLVFVTIGEARLRDGRVRRLLNALAVIASVSLGIRLLIVAIATDLQVGTTAYPAEAFYVSLAFALATVGAVLFSGARRQRGEADIPAPRWFAPAVTSLALAQTLATIVSIHDLIAVTPLRTIAGLISTLWILPWTVLLAFRLAQARYADVALKRSLAVLASVSASGVLAWWFAGHAATTFVLATLSVAALVASSRKAHRTLDRFVDRALLGRPAYPALSLAFAESARRTSNSDTLFATAAALVSETLRIRAQFARAPVVRAEADAPVLASFPAGTRHVLQVMATTGARSLMREELAFLEAIAREVEHRLESLEFENERREAQAREARLQHSLIEAELKALRAQVDPHFLFNTLNTIADLTTRNPQQAETMTERLAECFRYTLSRQERTLSTLEEELQFVRRYLDIEQVRFGDRLRVHIDGDEDVCQERVPSLILQPLVENAVRHGLAAKPEGGVLSVTAKNDGEYLRLTVSDDGIGIALRASERRGIGLSNVRDRLQALYRERAEMNISAGELGRGTSITLRVPKHVR
jgi:two-component sensor histidine kinase